MTLDLSKPEHREALRWACRLVDAAPRSAFASYRPADPTYEEMLRMSAVLALSSPAESAAIVRAELERCGTTATVRIVTAIEPPYLSVDDGTYDNMISSYDVPALILRLLDATTREEALAALRGAS